MTSWLKIFPSTLSHVKYLCIFRVKVFENSPDKCRHYRDKNHPLTEHKLDKGPLFKKTTKFKIEQSTLGQHFEAALVFLLNIQILVLEILRQFKNIWKEYEIPYYLESIFLFHCWSWRQNLGIFIKASLPGQRNNQTTSSLYTVNTFDYLTCARLFIRGPSCLGWQ